MLSICHLCDDWSRAANQRAWSHQLSANQKRPNRPACWCICKCVFVVVLCVTAVCSCAHVCRGGLVSAQRNQWQFSETSAIRRVPDVACAVRFHLTTAPLSAHYRHHPAVILRFAVHRNVSYHFVPGKFCAQMLLSLSPIMNSVPMLWSSLPPSRHCVVAWVSLLGDPLHSCWLLILSCFTSFSSFSTLQRLVRARVIYKFRKGMVFGFLQVRQVMTSLLSSRSTFCWRRLQSAVLLWTLKISIIDSRALHLLPKWISPSFSSLTLPHGLQASSSSSLLLFSLSLSPLSSVAITGYLPN